MGYLSQMLMQRAAARRLYYNAAREGLSAFAGQTQGKIKLLFKVCKKSGKTLPCGPGTLLDFALRLHAPDSPGPRLVVQ